MKETMSDTNGNGKSKDRDASTDNPADEATREHNISPGGFPSSPGADETPQQTATGETSSAPEPEKEADVPAEKHEKPEGSPYQNNDDGGE